MAGAEIVEIDPATQLGERADVAGCHVIVGVRHHAFEDFDTQPVGGEAEAVQLPLQAFDKFRIGQFILGEIHGDLRDAALPTVPVTQGGERMVEDDLAKTFHEPLFGGGGQEIGRKDDALFRMLPSGQGLEAGYLAGIGGHLRLEPRPDLPELQSFRQFGADARTFRRHLPDFRRIGPDGACAVGRGRHRGGARAVQNRFSVRGRRAPRHAEAHRGREVNPRGIDRDGFSQSGLHARPDLQQGLQIDAPGGGEDCGEGRALEARH